MEFWQKIFRSKQEDKEKKINGAIDDIDKIVNDYGEFMQSPLFPAPGCIADTKKLPYIKENIKNALIISLKLCDDSRMKEMLKIAYLGLADFQDGVGEKDVGLDTRKFLKSQNIDKEQFETISKKMDEMMTSFDHFKKIADNERQSLMKDVGHF